MVCTIDDALLCSRAKTNFMGEANNKKNKTLFGIGFVLSLAGMLALIAYQPQFFWLLLPSTLTFFARYLDVI